MRVLVTGGGGRIGRFVVRELIAAGHQVTSLDLAPAAASVPGLNTMRGDVTDAADVYGAIAYTRADAVVHLAAWPDPGFVPDVRTYADNTSATFNVLEICHSLAVARVIVASSAQVYGFAEHAPVYAPVDEAHPLRPLNSYALSKIAGEQAAAYFAAKGLNVLSVRIMGARTPDELPAEIAALRAEPSGDGKLLWTRTDARDIATGCRQALETARVESGAYNLTAARNVLGMSSRELLQRNCPTTEIRSDLTDDQSPLSTAKARKAFGYAPQFG